MPHQKYFMCFFASLCVVYSYATQSASRVMSTILVALFLLITICTLSLSLASNKPNVVFIIADDLGWNDVSFHGSDQILTPNIDLLAYSGVAFGRYYSHAMCTPSRSAFLTGKYSHKTGMQGKPLLMFEDRGIPVTEKLLPQYFKDAGYITRLIGKWHVGSSRNEYLPTSRGFDSHFGHRGGFIDYYEYTYEEEISSVRTASGFDLHRNETPAWDVEGYITDVYNDHAVNIIKNHDISYPLFLTVAHNAAHSGNDYAALQAPPEVVRKFNYVEMNSRRMFAAMVKKLDDSVGEIFRALYEKGILDKTIIAFVSDNGGITSGLHQNYASNYPMRGTKLSPFEGGVRVAGLAWSTTLKNENHFWDGYMHVTDWMPTLLSAAGIDIPSGIDGIDQWDNINRNAPSDRQIMYEIDDYTGYSSMTYGEYKLVTGTVPQIHSTYQGANLRGVIGDPPNYTEAIIHSTVYDVLKLLDRSFDLIDISLRNNTKIECNFATITMCMPDNDTVCLYNIIEDPCETTDLSANYTELVNKMKAMLKTEEATRIPRKVPFVLNQAADPRLYNYTWSPWHPDSTLR